MRRSKSCAEAWNNRTLQRILNQFVGVSPKWVIQRYRLREAGELIESDADMAELALDLGYFDQAHIDN